MTARERKPIEHGTAKGYGQHRHRGHVKLWNACRMDRCEPCISAHATYNANWRAERAAARPGQRPPENTYRKADTTRVPNDVLGALLVAAPTAVADAAIERLSPFVVKRALWAAGQAGNPQHATHWSAA